MARELARTGCVPQGVVGVEVVASASRDAVRARSVEANILLYAVNSDAKRHERSRRWLDEAPSGQDTIAFAWIALLAFVGLSTKVGLFPGEDQVQVAVLPTAADAGRRSVATARRAVRIRSV